MQSPWTCRVIASGLALAMIGLAGCGKSNNRPPKNGTPAPQSNETVEIKEQLVEPVLVVAGLTNPSGVAVQPGSGHVFVASKDGVARIVPGDKPALHPEIVGFPTDVYGKGPKYEIGPLGLAFLDDATLVVGDGSMKDGEEIVRFYAVGAQALPEGGAKKADEMIKPAGPIQADPDVSVKGEGNFFGVAVLGKTVFVTCNGDDTKGWIAKVDFDREKPGALPLVPFIQTKVAVGIDAPTGITVKDGQLVVSQLGEITQGADSLLTFYDPASGKLTKKLTTGLNDLCGIAYSPKTGKLYGVDFSWSDPKQAGLYRLDVSGDKVAVTRLARLDRPTALAFAPDGTLYVTVIGAGVKQAKPGQVILFKGL